MNKFFTFVSTKLLPNIILLTVVGATVAVGIYSATKVSTTGSGVLDKSIKEVVLADTQLAGTSNGSTGSNNNPGGSNTQTNTTNAKLCLVKISGRTYNVYNLRSTHSGGDVFTCNTDMTSIYQRQHGMNMSLIQPYLYTGPTQASITQSGSRTSGTGKSVSVSNGKTFDLASLALHNTGSSCYIAYGGKVYSVTNNPSWGGCRHHGISGGKDITSVFPHPTSYLSTLPVVGTYAGTSGSGTGTGTGGTTTNTGGSDDSNDDNDNDQNDTDSDNEHEIEIEHENNLELDD